MTIGQEKCSDFYRILIQGQHQSAYHTAFYGCVGCSTMFTDPYKFTQSVQTAGPKFGSSTYGRSGG